MGEERRISGIKYTLIDTLDDALLGLKCSRASPPRWSKWTTLSKEWSGQSKCLSGAMEIIHSLISTIMRVSFRVPGADQVWDGLMVKQVMVVVDNAQAVRTTSSELQTRLMGY
jgi:hypothetical protein